MFTMNSDDSESNDDHHNFSYTDSASVIEKPKVDQPIQNPNFSPNYRHIFKSSPIKHLQEDDDSNNADVFLSINLGPDAFKEDDNCPLSLSIVQHHIDEFQYHIQKQQNELFFINNNIKQIKGLLDNLHDENQILQSIIDEFTAESNVKRKMLNSTALKPESTSPKVDEYLKKVEDTFFGFLDQQTKLTNDASDLSQYVENIRMLKSMNRSLNEYIQNNPEEESDRIIDLLENEIEKLESYNTEMNLKYRDIIREKQKEIDELELQLNSAIEPTYPTQMVVKSTPKKLTKKKKKTTPKKSKD